MDLSLLGALGQRLMGVLTNDVLIAIPLFVMMGVILEKSRIAEELLETMGRLFGQLRGGLGVSVVLVGALLAASTGIVGATVVAMGLIALPAMLRTGYDPRLASGIVCTAGTLGQIIPPSTMLIILTDVMSNAYQQAQFKQGKFSIETISVGQLFAAALVPGLTLVAIYIVYVLLVAWLRPKAAPAVRETATRLNAGQIAGAIVPPILLMVSTTWSAPMEAGAMLMVGHRLGASPRLLLLGAACLAVLAVGAGVAPVRLQRTDIALDTWLLGGLYAALAAAGFTTLLASVRTAHAKRILVPALTSTMTVTAMIFATILTASVFSLVFIGLGGEDRVAGFLKQMPGGPTGALVFCMALVFVLGFFLDFVEIAVILLPLIAPPLLLMGHDPVWLSILFAINLQTSFLTPPFGFSLFYLRGAAPPEITTGHIYAGVAPFIGLQVVGMAVIWLVPAIATWLPKLVF